MNEPEAAAARDLLERASAARWALDALRAHVHTLGAVQAQDRNAALAFRTAVEAVWWVAALDEQCSNYDNRRDYLTRRRSDPDGQLVEAMRWLRDRHTHQVPITIGPDATKFFPGPPFHFRSETFLWVRSDHIARGRSVSDTQTSREHFDRHLAERSVPATLCRAVEWFDREATHPAGLLAAALAVAPALPPGHRIDRRSSPR